MILTYFCTSKKSEEQFFVFFQVDLVAQLVEHNTFNVGVLGSSPSGITGAASSRFFYAQISRFKRAGINK